MLDTSNSAKQRVKSPTYNFLTINTFQKSGIGFDVVNDVGDHIVHLSLCEIRRRAEHQAKNRGRARETIAKKRKMPNSYEQGADIISIEGTPDDQS